MKPCAQCAGRGRSSFRALQPAVLACLEKGRAVEILPPGRLLYAEGEFPTAAFCVKSGRVALYRYGPDGRRKVMRIVRPGGLIGAASVLTGTACFDTAEVVIPTVVCRIGGRTLREVLSADPALWEQIVLDLCVRLQALEARAAARA